MVRLEKKETERWLKMGQGSGQGWGDECRGGRTQTSLG